MKELLKFLLDMATERWAYAIIWTTNITATSGVPLLSWCDGFHVGCSDERWSNVSSFFDFSKAKSYNTEGIAGTALLTGSPAWSTAAGNKPCERALHSLQFGICTLACFPLDIGVLELGSTDALIPANSDVISTVYAIFNFNGVSARPWFVRPNLGNISVTEPLISSRTIIDEESHVSAPDKGEEKKRKRDQAAAVGRRRRERLKERFNALRAVVPEVTKMDKPLLLANAVTLINDLSAKLESIESGNAKMRATIEKLQRLEAARNEAMKIEMKIMGRREAVIRVESSKEGHPSARLMGALSEVGLEVVFATVTVVKELMVQEVKVASRDGMYIEEQLIALIHKDSRIQYTSSKLLFTTSTNGTFLPFGHQ